MAFPRRSGVLLHPTSLPGPYGIGDLGDAAYEFVDFLERAGQTYWQILPLSPTGYADSPYQALSAFAGNPMLISPDRLAGQGHLTAADLSGVPLFPTNRVDYGWIIQYKTALLHRAFDRFRQQATGEERAAFDRFCREQASWLESVALYMALKEHFKLKPWYKWDKRIAFRQPDAVLHWQALLAERIESQKYRQWQFYEQWLAVKAYANERGILIIGDIPLYVARDSADVWANPHLFHSDENLKPTIVSGVPPDYFSKTGQLWGHPIYRWDVIKQENYAWWVSRFRAGFTLADVVRIDHFRGFYNYWEVPASHKTAMRGRWRFGPGAELFRVVTRELGDLRIIAEDLGDFDVTSRAGLDALQEEFGYPGMRVLQFAFAGTPLDPFLPHTYKHDCIVYTGTHDNDTTQGWYAKATEKEKDYVRRYLGASGADIAWDLIRLGWMSAADTAITTVQDLLNLGAEARMNTPSTSGSFNWSWRMQPGQPDNWVAARLCDLTYVYGRTVPALEEEDEVPGESRAGDQTPEDEEPPV